MGWVEDLLEGLKFDEEVRISMLGSNDGTNVWNRVYATEATSCIELMALKLIIISLVIIITLIQTKFQA